ncbi:MAG: flagellar basal-body MS-ring/collar protein FliF [Heliobacteriaceae bacterium]|nr:flagellar basal-body MS-ring/collar protein FliF [Heliobacteriaceae bacterium]
MNELIERIQTQLNETFAKLSRRQKFILGGLSLATIGFLLFFLYWAGRPDYISLYPRLDATDAGAIRAKLQEMKADFKVADDGSILVPSKDQAGLRLELANANLPRGTGWGYETFNESRFGESEKEKEIRLKVATETELARTLQNIPGVENARVLIVPAADSLFKDKATNATASVMMILKSYTQLEEKQVRGIVHLVSHSVKALKPENVTVVDNNGNVLTEGLFNDTGKGVNIDGLTKQQMQAKKEYEKHLEQKAQDMLNRVVGVGNSIVKVATELDFSQQETRGVTHGKPVGPVSSREITESGQGVAAGGTPGTSANIPTQQGVVNETSSYTRTDITTNNEVPKTETHVITPPGSVKRLSVSVMVNRAELTPEETQQFEKAVAQAVGIKYPLEPNALQQPGQLERVEQISVVGMAFDRSAVDEANRLAQEAKTFQWLALAGIALAVIAAVVGGLFAWRRYRARRGGLAPEEEVQFGFDAEAIMPPPLGLTPEELEKQALREQVAALSDTDPEAVARLLKSWLADDTR